MLICALACVVLERVSDVLVILSVEFVSARTRYVLVVLFDGCLLTEGKLR